MGGRSSVTGQTVTVFGCTGFIGRYIVNRLGQKGTQVVVPFRGEVYNMMHLKPMGDLGQIVPVRVDLRDEATLSESVSHSDVVINLIGKTCATRNFSLYDVNVKGAGAIARVCRDQGVPRLIHLSHIQASHESRSAFLRAKAAGEEAVKAEYPSAVIVRPAVVFGNEDRFINLLGAMLDLPFGYSIVNHGRAVRYPLDVSDLATALARLCLLEAAEGRTFDLYGPRSFTLRDIYELFMQQTIRPRRIINMHPRLMALHSKLYYDLKMQEDEIPNPQHDTMESLGMIRLRGLAEHILEYARSFRAPDEIGTVMPIPPQFMVPKKETGDKRRIDVAAGGD